MSDLIERLREGVFDENDPTDHNLRNEAADEIERLTQQRAHWETVANSLQADVERLTREDEVHWKTRRSLLADIERLRAALLELADAVDGDEDCSLALSRAREALK
jgi:chromosome segregation ATPase